MRSTQSLLILLFCFLFFICKSQCAWHPIGPDDHYQASTLQVDEITVATDTIGTTYIAYRSGNLSTQDKVNVMKWNGAQWLTVGAPYFSTGKVKYTQIAVDISGTPYVVYQDQARSNKATVMKFNGTNWVPVGTPGFSSGQASYTHIALDSAGTPYVSYSDINNGNKATVMKFDGTNWVLVGGGVISTGYISYNSLAIDRSGALFVLFGDGGNSGKSTVMKFDGTNWAPVGTAGFSYGGAGNNSLTLDSAGLPYVIYEDLAYGQKATVMKYNGSSWVTIGNPGFTYGYVYYPQIAFDASGNLYVMYNDYGTGNKTTVKKYTGSGWTNVGNQNFSYSISGSNSIAFDNTGTPIAAFLDQGRENRATVMKFNGTNWALLGNSGASGRAGWENSVKTDFAGTPYIAFTDPYALTSPTVKKFDGTSWVTVGGAPVSTGQATYLDFAIDPSGVPYVFYTDYSVSNKGTVKKFDGTNWVTVGPLGFTAGQCGSNSMVIDKTGVPYVCFNDAGNGGGVSVMKFNGSNWVYVGAPSCVRAGPYNMVLDTAGTPYFSCLSPTLAGISVLKYIAGNWSFVGDSNFVLPFGPSQLLIDKTNTPNLFYYNQTGHVVSRKFNGATWDSSSFFPILDIFPSFTMDSLGRTYMIYDDTSGVKLVVRRFNGNTWDLIGNANFTGGGATHRNIHFSNKGELYTSCTSAGVYVYKLVLDSTNAGITGTACSGGSANFYANGGQWYNWVGPGGFSSTAQNPVLNPVSSVQNGTYTVTISDTGCAAVKKINLIVKANPTVTLSSNSTTFCIGDNAVTLTGNPSGGTFTGAGVNGNTFDPAISGVGVFNIYYSYTNVFGCGNIDSLQMTVSGCSNINSIDQKEIEIYPNPFNTTITIGKVSSPANIKIKDVIGRFVYETHTETESTTINPGILQNGVYFIYIQNAQGTYTQKLLKQ